MKNSEIRELTEKELTVRLKDEQEMLVKLRFGHAISPVENPNKIKGTRRLIARLLTEKKRRSLNVQNS
ncbi:MAG: 50S ribosomal protein L29 [Bacteroidia bacterium]